MNKILHKPFTKVELNPERKLHLVGEWVDPISTVNPWRRRLQLLSSSSKRKITLKKFFTKFLWSGCNSLELEALIYLAVEMNDELILETLRLRENLFLSLLRARFNALRRLMRKQPLDLKYFLSSNDFILIVKEDKILSPSSHVRKYTGWARHQNDQGSINPFHIDPMPLEVTDNFMKINIRSALTVGRILPSETGGESSLTSALIRAETVKFLQLVEEYINESF